MSRLLLSTEAKERKSVKEEKPGGSSKLTLARGGGGAEAGRRRGSARRRRDILEFGGVGRHEGPKALISERTPRQTERGGEARKERMEEREEKKTSAEKGQAARSC